MKNQYYCVVKNRILRDALLAAVEQTGIKISHSYGDEYNRKSPIAYPEFLLNDNANKGAGFAKAGTCNTYQKLVSVEEMFDIIARAKKKIFKLSDVYTAELDVKGVLTVGCQTFEKAKVDAFISWYKVNNN